MTPTIIRNTGKILKNSRDISKVTTCLIDVSSKLQRILNLKMMLMSLKLTSFISGEVNCKNRKSGDTLKTLKIHQLKKLIFAIGTVLSKELP